APRRSKINMTRRMVPSMACASVCSIRARPAVRTRPCAPLRKTLKAAAQFRRRNAEPGTESRVSPGLSVGGLRLLLQLEARSSYAQTTGGRLVAERVQAIAADRLARQGIGVPASKVARQVAVEEPDLAA